MLDKLLTSHFCNAHNIPYNQPYKIEWINPNDLITKERIDIIVKLKMLLNISGQTSSSFFNEVYVKHIEAFSLGTFSEPGDNQKNNINDYIQTFIELYNDIYRNGFDENKSVIPVGRNNIILNGSHRTAIAIFLGIKIPIIRFDNLEVDYSIEFFRKRKTDEKLLNYLILEYLNYSQDIFTGCIWPIAYDGRNLFYELLEEMNLRHKLVTISEHYLEFHAHFNLVLEIYSHQNWLGNAENNYPGAFSKANLTYKKSNPVIFFILEKTEETAVSKLKEIFREIISLDKHSIHITDNSEEAKSLSNIFCNSNSIKMLNLFRLSRYPKSVYLLNEFKHKLLLGNINFNDVIVTSSIIIGLIGIREPRDIDFFYNGYSEIELESHNAYLKHIGKSINELNTNPENYFYFNNLKFLTIENLIVFKKNRNEKKDKFDVANLTLLNNNFLKTKPRTFFINCSRKIYYTKLRVKGVILFFIIKTLKKLKLYSIGLKILKFIRISKRF